MDCLRRRFEYGRKAFRTAQTALDWLDRGRRHERLVQQRHARADDPLTDRRISWPKIPGATPIIPTGKGGFSAGFDLKGERPQFGKKPRQETGADHGRRSGSDRLAG